QAIEVPVEISLHEHKAWVDLVSAGINHPARLLDGVSNVDMFILQYRGSRRMQEFRALRNRIDLLAKRDEVHAFVAFLQKHQPALCLGEIQQRNSNASRCFDEKYRHQHGPEQKEHDDISPLTS